MLFDSLVNTENWWKESKMALCFTRCDIFKEKIKSETRPLSEFSPEYEGALTDVDACREYITTRFTDLIRDRDNMEIFYVNTTDTGHVRQVVDILLGGYDTSHDAPSTSSSGFSRYHWERDLNTAAEAL